MGTYDYPSVIVSVWVYFLIGIATRLALPYLTARLSLTVSLTLVLLLFLVSFEFQLFPFVVWIAVIATIGSVHNAGKQSYLTKTANVLLANPVSIWLGLRSYSVYLSHAVILVAIKFAVVSWDPSITRLRCGLLLFLAGVPLIVVGSHLLYSFIERPSIAFGRQVAGRMGRRPRELSIGVGKGPPIGVRP